MKKKIGTVPLEQALQTLIGYLSPELVTVCVMHEHNCFLRRAVETLLEEAGMSADQLVTEWFERGGERG